MEQSGIVRNTIELHNCHVTAPYRCSSQTLLKLLHCLPVIERVEYIIAAMTYKIRLHQQPSYLLQHISQYQPACSLRSSNSVLLTVPPTTKTITVTRASCISTPTVSNSLPSAVREASSQPQFLCRLKGHLFQHVFG